MSLGVVDGWSDTPPAPEGCPARALVLAGFFSLIFVITLRSAIVLRGIRMQPESQASTTFYHTTEQTRRLDCQLQPPAPSQGLKGF